MLQVHSSNHLESLLDQLLTRINVGDPFCSEILVVENPGMSRWLQQRIADYDGISANLKFISPARFIWESAQCWISDLPDPLPRNSTRLQWRIFELLPDFLDQSVFSELQSYLQDDQTGLHRFQLAGRIAGTYERYLIYRSDLIEAWQQGRDVHWQAILWRAIAKDTPYTWGDLRTRLISDPDTPPNSPLPQQVSVFGVSDMAPIYIDLLQCIAEHSNVCIYYLNPCTEYWADIKDSKSQARRRAKAYQSRVGMEEDPAGLLDIGNPLLASWGHAGQAFLDQLLERQVEETESFVVPTDLTLLHSVQRDILQLEDKSNGDKGVLTSNDRSVCIHSAHSPLREVQILHDQLLHLFSEKPDLTPRDIIVMAPDIDQYAPFVNATFGTAPNNQFIPWSISDRRMRAEQQLLEALLILLQLPESRFESTDVFALLQVPAVRRKFSLERKDLNRLHQWIQESGIRWSLDADMRTELGLPEVNTNSWHFGFQRMFLGYAMPATDETLFEGIAPYTEVEGTDSDRLEKLQLFIDLAQHWRCRLNDNKHRPLDWLAEIDQLSEAFFAADHSEDYALRSLREVLIAAFSEAGDAVITRDVLTEVVQTALDDNSNVRQFLNGKVTFSNMVPMRCIPFKVICILGMNANDFPREDRPMSFDLTRQQPRRGDRTRANDDRYLFLETLLSAREVFYLSYVGKDVRDNTDKAPATVVTELLEYVNDSYTRETDENAAKEQAAIQVAMQAVSVLQHPLQPFSKRYFDQVEENLHNFKPLWFTAANTERKPVRFIDRMESRKSNDKSPSSDARLEAPSKQVALIELIDFYSRPSQHYMLHQLQVRLPYVQDDLEAAEQFELFGLEQWAVNKAVLDYGRVLPKTEVKRTLDARGVMPEGVVGTIAFDRSYKGAVALDRRILIHEPKEPRPPLDVVLQAGEFLLEGSLSAVGNNGLFFWRPGKKRAPDVLSTWIQHLCLCAMAPVDVPKHSVYVFSDVTLDFREVPDPLVHLQNLLALRHRSLLQPQMFFPSASMAFANEYKNNSGPALTIDEAGPEVEQTGVFKARKEWLGDRFTRPEYYKDLNHIVWRGYDSVLGDEFRQLAKHVFDPLLQYAEETPQDDELPEELPTEFWQEKSSEKS